MTDKEFRPLMLTFTSKSPTVSDFLECSSWLLIDDNEEARASKPLW